ncbi:MAG TPA: amidase family protein, partial [Candidatus Nanopelagicaceae bacterium]
TVVSRALPVLEDLGASVTADKPRISDPFKTLMPISAADLRLALRGLSSAARDELFPETLVELDDYPEISASDFEVVLSQLRQLRAVVANFFDNYDLMVMPATAVPAYPLRQPPTRIGSREVKPGWVSAMPFAALWNMTGQPVASVPCGLTPEGLPAGLMIVGRVGAELDVLHASAALEIAMPWSTQVPKFVGTR